MKTIYNTTFTPQQQQQVNELIELVSRHDSLFEEPFLSNDFNYNQAMPCNFFTYDDQQLVAFMIFYTDDPAEPSSAHLYVHPDYRNQKIASNLIQTALEITAPYHQAGLEISIEKHILDKYPYLVKKSIDPDFEFILQRNNLPFTLEETPITIQLTQPQHSKRLAEIQAEAFDMSVQDAADFIEVVMNHPDELSYTIFQENQIVGNCCIDCGGKNNHFFALVVDLTYRNQKIAQQALKLMVNDILISHNRPCRIVVDHDNPVAKYIYEKVGFKVITQVHYINI